MNAVRNYLNANYQGRIIKYFSSIHLLRNFGMENIIYSSVTHQAVIRLRR